MGPKHVLLLLIVEKMDAEKFPPYLAECLERIDLILRYDPFLSLTVFALNHVFFSIHKNIFMWIEYLLRQFMKFFDMCLIVA